MSRSLICPHCRHLITDDSRSQDHHRAFFAFMKHCFDSWPEGEAFTPQSADHLRQWALVECGHIAPPMTWAFAHNREHNTIMPFVTQYIAHKVREGRFIWARDNGGRLEMIEAASIDWSSLGQRKFNEISGSVFDLMKEHGFDFEEWKSMERQQRKDTSQ
jgi:hypothetical protein